MAVDNTQAHEELDIPNRMTMTMTHSDEVTNGSQKPDQSVRLAQQARRTLGALFKKECTESRHAKQNNRRML